MILSWPTIKSVKMATSPYIYAFLLASLAQTSYAGINYPVKCPKYSTIKPTTEDVLKYEGTWYDVYHSDIVNYVCASANKTITPNGTGFTETGTLSLLFADGSIINSNLDYFLPSTVLLGEFNVEDPNGDWISFTELLAYDYLSYLLTYSCNQTKTGIVETFHALTRSKILSQTVKDKVKEVTDQHNITIKIDVYTEKCTLY